MNKKNENINSLDGLRGIAVLIVISSHAGGSAGLILSPYLNFTGYGQFGVYLFFFLSSFLLSYQFFVKPDMLNSIRELTSYAIKRVLRIIPLYYLVLITDYLFVHYYFGTEVNSTHDISSLIKHLTLVVGMGIFWTIPVEVKFYLVLPFVVSLILLALRNKAVMIILMFLFGVYIFLNAKNTYTNHWTETLFIHRYLPIFLTGVLTGCIYVKTKGSSWWNGKQYYFELVAIIIGLFLLLQNPYFWFKITGLGKHPYDPQFNLSEYNRYRHLMGALLIPIFTLAFLNGKGYIQKFFSSYPLRLIGRVSFSMYLLHMPMIEFIRNYDFPIPIKTSFVYISAFLISLVTYNLIEKPFINLAKLISTKINRNPRNHSIVIQKTI